MRISGMRISSLLTIGLAAMLAWPATAQAADTSPAIKIVLPDAIDNLDPCRSARNDVGRIIKENITETLTEIDPSDGHLVPRLATSWEQLDAKTWRIHLRTGVKFSDGTVFDAAAVAHSIERTMNPTLDCTNRQKFFGGVEITTKAVDANTIDIATTTPQPILPTLLSTLTIVSPKTPVDKATNEPVGTGPYTLASWVPGQQAVLQRFDGYWGAKPQIAQATFVYRAETAVAAAMVTTGEADLAPYIAVQDATDTKTDVSYLNTDTARIMISLDVPPLNDVRVRKAINFAIDRQAFVGSILSKDVQPASQLVLPFINGYNPDLKPWPADPDKAKALLAAAKADGVPVDAPITLYGRPGFFPNQTDVMEALAQMLQGVGLNVKVQMLEKAQFIDMVTQPHSPTMKPSLFLNLHDNSTGDAIFTLFFKYSSEGGQSFTHDKKLDALIADGSKATGDTRTKDFREAFKVITDDIVSGATLWHLVGYVRVGSRIEFHPTALTNNEIHLADIKLKAAS